MSDENSSYAVGDKRPPVHSRYEKGKSGNPSGRRKGQHSVQDLMLREASRLVKVKNGNKVETITKHEVVVRRLWALGMTGELAAIRLLLQFMATAPVNPIAGEPENGADLLPAPATPDDDAIRRMMARFAHLQEVEEVA